MSFACEPIHVSQDQRLTKPKEIRDHPPTLAVPDKHPSRSRTRANASKAVGIAQALLMLALSMVTETARSCAILWADYLPYSYTMRLEIRRTMSGRWQSALLTVIHIQMRLSLGRSLVLSVSSPTTNRTGLWTTRKERSGQACGTSCRPSLRLCAGPLPLACMGRISGQPRPTTFGRTQHYRRPGHGADFSCSENLGDGVARAGLPKTTIRVLLNIMTCCIAHESEISNSTALDYQERQRQTSRCAWQTSRCSCVSLDSIRQSSLPFSRGAVVALQASRIDPCESRSCTLYTLPLLFFEEHFETLQCFESPQNAPACSCSTPQTHVMRWTHSRRK